MAERSTGDSERGGSSRGPSQPSCKPRTYSFHVCRPRIRSPCTPSHSLIPRFCRACSSNSSSPWLDSEESSCDLSPFRFRSFRIFSARPALTSPSRRPSITSQSRAPATRTGFIYSWKCSRATLNPSPGGAERTIVIRRGMTLTGRGSWAR